MIISNTFPTLSSSTFSILVFGRVHFVFLEFFFMKITSNFLYLGAWLCLIGFKAEFSGRGKKPQATYLWSHCHLKHCQYALSYYTNWHKTAKSYICIYVWKSPWSFPSSVSVIDGLGEVGEGGTLEEEKIYTQIWSKPYILEGRLYFRPPQRSYPRIW